MAGTPTSDQIKFGILRTRDLVELYYQGRMNVSVVLTNVAVTLNIRAVLVPQNASRIRYEFLFENIDATGVAIIDFGTPFEIDSGNSQEFVLNPHSNLLITRQFRDDLEGVCIAQSVGAAALSGTPQIFVGVRETLLTPLPADELP